MGNMQELSLFPEMEENVGKSNTDWRNRVRGQGMLRMDLFHEVNELDDGFPLIKQYLGPMPQRVIDYKTAKSHLWALDGWVHFFLDDVCFNDLWNAKYTRADFEILKHYKGMFTPDYSLLLDMPYPAKVFNVYRNRTIGHVFQAMGGNVIPTVSWAERDSFSYCFKGLPKESVVAISTNGVKRNFLTRKCFLEGLFEMERTLHPSKIIVYGEQMEMKTKADLLFFPNDRICHLRDLPC